MIKTYTIENNAEWDSVVRSFKDYDVYWLSGYVKAFQVHGDGEPLLIYFEDKSTRGINVVMKRDIAQDERYKGILEENRYFDFSTPYGYGGWIIEGYDTHELFRAYQRWAVNNEIISEFVRFHPMIKNHETCEVFYEVVQLGEVVHMDLDSPESVWMNICSKNRNMIRKAIKNEINIYNGRFPEIYDKFRTIYNATMDKDNADKYYYFDKVFYESIMNDLAHNAQVFWAEKEGEVIAASIMLSANGKMNYHLSGSIKEFSSLAPTNLLLYQAALWGSLNGYKTLYLGGGVGSGEDNLFKFKKSFYKGALNRFYIGKKIYDQKKYCELVDIRKINENNAFFPLYRA